MVIKVAGRYYALSFFMEDLQHSWQMWFLPYDRATAAVLQDESGFRTWKATSYCSKSDVWNPREGERLAFERVVHLAFRSREDRAAAWQQFLTAAVNRDQAPQAEGEGRASAPVSGGSDHPARHRGTSRQVDQSAVGQGL